jgi:cytochrome c
MSAETDTAALSHSSQPNFKEYLMKRILLALVAAIAVSAPALADEALAKAKKCATCHAVDKTKVGPSYKAISTKYAGNKDAAGKLATVILKGGKGSFGDVDMPPSAGVNEAEAKQLVAWILSLK